MAKYIDAERALFVVKGLRGPTRSPAQNEMIQRAISGIERLPTADVEPVRHGRWDKPLDRRRKSAFCCSECRIITYSPWDYCPYCGAKMDAGDEKARPD